MILTAPAAFPACAAPVSAVDALRRHEHVGVSPRSELKELLEWSRNPAAAPRLLQLTEGVVAHFGAEQICRHGSEGLAVSARGGVDLERFGWRG